MATLTETTRLSLIYIMSRKGGVGKTSLGLSTAIQLASAGKKVAFLDLDTQGTHLAQVLPLEGHVKVSKAGKYVFDPDRYMQLKFYNWRITMDPPAGHDKPEWLETLYKIELSPSVRSKILEALSDSDDFSEAKLDLVQENLGVMLCSPYTDDIIGMNKKCMTQSGQSDFINMLSRLTSTLESADYQYLIVDNSPGLSFNPSVSLGWAGQQQSVANREVHLWMPSNMPWWELGLCLYETSTFRSTASKLNPVLIVNRAQEEWGGVRVGESIDLAESDLARTRVSEAFIQSVAVPSWLVAGASKLKFRPEQWIPKEIRLAVLRSDRSFATTHNPPIESAGSNQLSDRSGGVNKKLYDRWGLKSEVFVSDFWKNAIAASLDAWPDSELTFHNDVNTALTSKLLESDVRSGISN